MMRRSSCCAMDSATSCASSSGLHFSDVDVRRNAHDVGDFLAQLLDIFATLADDHARTRAEDGDARGLGRAFDQDLRDPGLRQLLAQHLAHLEVRREVLGIQTLVGKPLGIPVLGNAQADTGRMDFMTH